jgi:CRISPR-associated protein Cmr4
MSESTAQVRILFLHAQTGIHPGSGTSLGAIDLPVNRERHTQWPLIASSSLKGVLRHRGWEAAKSNLEAEQLLFAAFGPDVAEASEHAGAVNFSDARLLAFPIRSLKGVFAWITCPAVLERFTRDLAVVDFLCTTSLPSVDPVDPGHALCASKALVIQDDKMLLEEFEFTCMADAESAKQWAKVVARAVHVSARERLKSHLVILAYDDFTYFVRNATEIVAGIGLDYELKTVRGGALFYQEFMPAESVFYALVLANPSRRKEDKTTATGPIKYLERLLSRSPVIQVGGDETLGRGWCVARLDESESKEVAP